MPLTTERPGPVSCASPNSERGTNALARLVRRQSLGARSRLVLRRDSYITVRSARAVDKSGLLRVAVPLRWRTGACAFLRPSDLGHLLPQTITLHHSVFEPVLNTLCAGKEGLLPDSVLLMTCERSQPNI